MQVILLDSLMRFASSLKALGQVCFSVTILETGYSNSKENIRAELIDKRHKFLKSFGLNIIIM